MLLKIVQIPSNFILFYLLFLLQIPSNFKSQWFKKVKWEQVKVQEYEFQYNSLISEAEFSVFNIQCPESLREGTILKVHCLLLDNEKDSQLKINKLLLSNLIRGKTILLSMMKFQLTPPEHELLNSIPTTHWNPRLRVKISNKPHLLEKFTLVGWLAIPRLELGSIKRIF